MARIPVYYALTWQILTNFMRIAIEFADRVGIAHEILALFAGRKLNLLAVEVEPPFIYIDSPDLKSHFFNDLQDACLSVKGVIQIREIDLLPGMRQRLHLHTMVDALQDPVLAVDVNGHIMFANATACTVMQLSAEALRGLALHQVFEDQDLGIELIHNQFRVITREVLLKGKPFFLDVTPFSENQSDGYQARLAGAVLTLKTPSRLGGHLHALQHGEGSGFHQIIGESTPMRNVKSRAARIAQVDAPLLITGETGTGKELLAQACHASSTRSQAPFFELNCAALPESLAESELFGYSAGAFTGAQRGGKPGLFELADGGCVFLDEIGEMSLYLQAKLLRFLNDGKFRRIGGEKEVKVNVRIISATHRNLSQMVAQGSFREDLYYRLNVLQIDMPALRERGEDILLLARHFIERACTQAGKPVCRLSQVAAQVLLRHRWPGNVRQLQNRVFRAVTLSDQLILDVSDLDDAEGSFSPKQDVAVEVDSWEHAQQNFERNLLENLYPQFPSSRKLAARLSTSHSMVASKLRKYGIPAKD